VGKSRKLYKECMKLENHSAYLSLPSPEEKHPFLKIFEETLFMKIHRSSFLWSSNKLSSWYLKKWTERKVRKFNFAF
jgi:hypothetical protein